MLQAASPVQPYSLRVRKSDRGLDREDMDDNYDDDDDEGSVGNAGNSKGKGSKQRRELPAGAVATLKAWLLSPEHFTHPYPTPQDQAMLMQKTGIDKKQLKNWFTNARRRIWKPMLKKQIEQGKLTATGAPGLAGAVPGLMLQALPGAASNAATGGLDNPHSIQAMRVHYQQAVQQQQDQSQQQPQAQQQHSSVDSFGNAIYSSLQTSEQKGQQPSFYASQSSDTLSQTQLAVSASLCTLPQLSSNVNLTKTDSHAVLMELFARDQDLVRQATESARLKAEAKQFSQTPQTGGGQPQASSSTSQHPMKAPSSGALQTVPTLNSWPQFSSITSLNNLGTMPGVKSIASLSGADLASKGQVNKMGNLAQVKSMESMGGKNDSYAFLEVFFGDRSSTNLSGMGGQGSQKGSIKNQGDEDNEIGLSLEDESPSQPIKKEMQVSMFSSSSQDHSLQTGTLKRAYDDALAARGLISVSRSCEKLTDLVLPAKIQRTLSQEFMNKQQQPQSQFYTSVSEPAPVSSHQYPGQQPVEPQGAAKNSTNSDSESNENDGSVQVSTNTTCALCNQTNVDTQLRPCGHMFHERCLKPSLQTPMGPPKCPVDDIPMQSALLAVPTEGISTQQAQQQWPYPNSHFVSADSQR